MSALKTQKIDHINLWMTKPLSGKYFDLVKDKVSVKQVEVPDFPGLKGKPDHYIPAHTKDYLAWKILYEYGGMCLDLDTFCLKDITELLGDKIILAPIDAPKVEGCDYPFNSAIVIAVKGSPLIKEVMESAEAVLMSNNLEWGDTGPIAFSNTMKKHLNEIAIPKFGVCGGFGGFDAVQLYREGTSLPQNTRIIHLFAVKWCEAVAQIDESYVDKSENLIARTIRNTLTRDERNPKMSIWQIAQAAEHNYWNGRGVINSYHDETLQYYYAEKIGLATDGWYWIDLQGKSVLDIGGGPSSFLLKTFNAGRRKVIDPLKYPDWVVARYKSTNIEVEQIAAEDMDEHGWDEVWLYNVLQHVRDPLKVIENIKKAGKVVRVFEFLEVPASDVHPHVLTADMLDNAFGFKGTIEIMNQDKVYAKVYYGIFTYEVREDNMTTDNMARWQKAQQSEASWWYSLGYGVFNSYHEEIKQLKYAEVLGLEPDQWQRINLHGKSVLDVGGGPVSLLLKTYNAGKLKVHDPLIVPAWVITRYKEMYIDLDQKPAEDMDESGWDEVWLYNVLQHVRDPLKVIENIKKAGKVVRVLDFIETSVDEKHLHTFTAKMLDDAFGRTGTVTQLTNTIVGGTVYYGVFDYSKENSSEIELHMVNTGTEFPYAYYLAVMSVLKTQKAAKVNLWLAKEPVGEYYDAIKDKVTIRRLTQEAPEFPALQNQRPGFKEAHMVDYYRWLILYENGGIFIDLDSLSLSDYCEFIEEKLSDNKEFVASLAVNVKQPKPYHNSLFAGKKGSPLVKQMLDECVKRLNDGTNFKWGNSGPDVLNDLCDANPDKIAEVEYGMLGGWLEMYQLWTPNGKIPDNARFLHLWANSINGYWTGINEQYIEDSDHVYAKLVRKVLTKEERLPFANKTIDHIGQHRLVYEPNANGYPMYLFADEKFITPTIQHDKVWEPEVTKFIKDKLKPDQTFIDVGAHIGYYAILASKIVGNEGKVYAFEPCSLSRSVLSLNLRLNKCNNVVVSPVAVSNAKGAIKLYAAPPGSYGQRSIVNELDTKDFDVVETDTLDNLVSGRVDMVKIDVEAAAGFVVEGMTKILSQSTLLHVAIEDKTGEAVKTLHKHGLDMVNPSPANGNYQLVNQPFDLHSRGHHYYPIFTYLRMHPCRYIMDIGTHDGKNAIQMIKAAASKVPEAEISYYGFDLFEDITPAVWNHEFSPSNVYDVSMVQSIIETGTSAKVKLFKGDTKKTLPIMDQLPSMDLIYIDGGHSMETIRNDWYYASKLMKPSTVVIFDDYYPELPFLGCKFLLDEIDKMKYDTEILPFFDDYPKEWGRLRTQLLAVQLKEVNMQRTSIIHGDKPALHVLGLAHTKTTPEYNACAYTQKILKMAKMMTKAGYEVYHYGAEGSTPECAEHIDVVSNAIQRQTYGDYDWHKEMFKHDPNDLAYKTFDSNAIREINIRKGPRDLLLISMGNYQKPISDAVGMMAVEMGVGYSGVYTNHRVFESYAWMHIVYGTLGHDANVDGNYYDCVIPNYYDPADFEFRDKKDDYYLYIGRLIPRKGVNIAAQCCERIGAKLVVAGQGTPDVLRTLGVDPNSVEFVGYADVATRSKLMSGAKAVFVPTLYIEPFGGVNVEAMFCGTPAITTDFGGFTETVQHGKTGYRCHTMDDFVWAAKNVDRLDPYYIRDYAVNNYSMDRVSLMYDEYFSKLMDLYRNGWYELHPERTELDWLRRY
jgi:FkbM family methyltransferase